ncbi:MAG: DEAD/DEAH box helicase family protein, partial [Enterococcus sp.]|nr:DEAD/DEAH box helicase family protein [Enterococcus sp.]
MLKEVRDLQNSAVSRLVAISKEEKTDYIFKAPTGSGKTYMMADFMDRVLSENENIVFLVSSPSKAGLAKQNFEKFEEYQASGNFQNLDSYLITSETGGEAGVFIPANHNVYVLPYSLTNRQGKIMKEANAFRNFLMEIRDRQLKQLWLIVDEGHIATNGLELFRNFFNKKFYFSATPDQLPEKMKHLNIDVEISEADAIQANLIKSVEYIENEYVSTKEGLTEAITKLKEI